LPEAPVNRLKDAAFFYVEQETAYKVQNPLAHKDDPDSIQHLKKQYENIIAAFRKTRELTPEERQTRAYLRHEVRRMRAKLSPTAFRSVVHFKPINWLLNSLLRRQANYARHNKEIAAYGKSTAADYNSEQLHQQMAKAGFTAQMEKALKKMMNLNLSEFSLRHVQPDAPNADFLLHFKKLPGRDVYYFKAYDAAPRPNIESVIANDPAVPKMSFFTDTPIKFSAQEAANLTNGRPVQKTMQDGLKYWYMQDHSGRPSLQQKFFDLSQALKDFPIKELKSPAQREKLLSNLQSGGISTVTLISKEGVEEKLQVKVGFNADKLGFTNQDGQYVDPTALEKTRAQVKQLHEGLKNRQSELTIQTRKTAKIH